MKKKTNRFYVLPSRLKAAKDQIQFPGKKTANKVSKLIFKLINDGMNDNFDLQKFQEIPSNYFRKVYGGNYNKEFMDILVEKGIVQVNESYSTGTDKTESFCKSFRIHPDLLDVNDQFVMESYVNEVDADSVYDDNYIEVTPGYTIQRVGTEYRVSSVANMLHKMEKSAIRSDLASLSYDTEAFRRKTEEVVGNICCTNFKVDDEVTENFFEVTNHIHGWTKQRSKKWCLDFCQEHGLTLIQDKRNFYIDDMDAYIAKKKKNILLNYTYYAKRLSSGIFNPDRNLSNNRLV